MNGFLKTAALSVGLALGSASAAMAACSLPSDLSGDILVLQMIPNAEGETYIGTAALAPDATSRGTVYFSLDQDDLVACDGVNWVSLGSAGETASGAAEYSTFVSAGELEKVTNPYGGVLHYKIPDADYDPTKKYKLTLTASSSGGYAKGNPCDVGQGNSGGRQEDLFVVGVDYVRNGDDGYYTGKTDSRYVEYIPNGSGGFDYGPNSVSKNGTALFGGYIYACAALTGSYEIYE